ncbi:MAG: DUF2933 domain-containing protein [Roseiflexaceae bacterium]
MAYLVSLLPALACPVLMGLMMWLMMRGNKNRVGEDAQQMDVRSPGNPMNTPQKRLMAGFHLCLNWKVVAGLAVVGLGIWAVAPTLVWAAVPVLLVLACPLSMLFMMRGMGSGQCATQPEDAQRQIIVQRQHDGPLVDLRARHAAIAQEIAELESASDATVWLVETDVRTHGAQVPS